MEARRVSPRLILASVAVAGMISCLAPAAEAQERRDDRPFAPRSDDPTVSPSRPGDRPALTAPERAREAEMRGRDPYDRRRDDRGFEGETYIGGFGGYTWGHDFNDAEGIGLTQGVNYGDRSLKNSGVYGLKLGYFHPGRWDWLGVELEGYNTSPHIEQDANLPGNRLRVTTLALNFIVRTWLACGTDRDRRGRDDSPHAFCRLQPYAGAGLGVFFAKQTSPFGKDHDVAPGLNLLAGLRYYLTDNMALFGEYKFNYATFDFEQATAVNAGLKGDYAASLFVGGVSLHF